MNIPIIVAIIAFWVSAFNFGMVLERIRQEKRGKKVVLHMELSKEEVEKMVDDAVAEVKQNYLPKKYTENLCRRLQREFLLMKSDRMSGDTPLIRQKEAIEIVGKYLEEVKRINNAGGNDGEMASL